MNENAALIGADPEVFLKILGTDFFVPSTDLIGGNKENPLKVTRGALQEDNVTAEINIDPTSNAEEFSYNIGVVMDSLKEKVGPNLELSIQASAEFSMDMLDHPKTKEIGCDPDYNAYTQKQNKYDVDYENSGMRYAGGHIHIGAKEIVQRPQEILSLVKMMDLHVGSMLSLLDKDTERCKFYGKAGNYRVKPYGIEYRTASNIWLSSKALMEDVHYLTQRAFNLWERGIKTEPERLAEAINNRDAATLYNIMPVPTKAILRKHS